MTIASRNVALPHGKNKKTTNSTLAATETTAIGRQPGSLRTARAIVSGASTPVAMINRNAIPCTQPCQVGGFPRRELEAWRSSETSSQTLKPEYWVALGAAVSILSLLVAGFSLIYVRRSAKASREQTKQQKQAAKDATQPMVWVDVRGDDGQG